MEAAAAEPSELQQLGRDDLLKLLEKQAEQQKTLKEQLAAVTKEKDDALAQLSVVSTSNRRAESPENDREQQLEDLRLEFEAKLAKEKFASQEVNSSLKAMKMALADYDKQIKKFKEEKASKASKLESALKDRDELSARLGIVEAELANTKQFSDHLEKALECAKAEAEELRLQKQDAESQRIELMQVKMDEDSHSSWEVVDLTNELSQNSEQIESLRSALVSVETGPSFCDFTVAVQHAIMRYMDVKDFFKTAITSKKTLEVAKECSDKHWDDVSILEDGAGRRYFSQAQGRAHCPSLQIFNLLFHRSTVSKLTLFGKTSTSVATDLRAKEFDLNFPDPELLAMLVRHRPAGGYGMLSIQQAIPANKELLQFLSESAEVLKLNTVLPISQYTQLKMPEIRMEANRTTRSGLEAYLQVILAEWQAGVREVRIINLVSNPLFDTIDPPLLLAEYPKFFRTYGRECVYYRVSREDGAALLVRFFLTLNIVEIADVEHTGIDDDDDRDLALMVFVFNGE